MRIRPNFLFILTDDHAFPAVSCYDTTLINTPNIDSIAEQGVRFERALVSNSLCSPSRASFLTGTYGHVNGVTTLDTPIDASQPTFVSALKEAGYRTAFFGKWHMGHGQGHDPEGFDYWEVYYDQGTYIDPIMRTADGDIQTDGYATDLLTERAQAWLNQQPDGEPWCLLVWHKAPHRPWVPHPRHTGLFTDPIPLPDTFEDDYSGRGTPAHKATMRVADDLADVDLKEDPPGELNYQQMAEWKYQRFLSDYLRCIAAVDESVGSLREAIRLRGESAQTMTIYGSDNGFFLGHHGWFDKRFMYEESLRIPLVLSYPQEIPSGQVRNNMVSNVDIAQTILDAANVPAPPRMQGISLLPDLKQMPDPEIRDAFYYRFYEHDDHMHHVWAHYGIRTNRYKLVYYYADGMGLPNTGNVTYPPEWELFDLEEDPQELNSVYFDPRYRHVKETLKYRLAELQEELGDQPYHRPSAEERAQLQGHK